MTDENANTADLTMDEKLDRILTDLADVKTRLGALETQGANTTRPILDQIIREVVETRDRLIEEIATLRGEFNVVTADLIALRARGDRLDRRLSEIEQRPN
ncbi:MAG: hypothetical protein MOB07_16425 [Acidobacteria bacterium]|nr:hypothetical protein [Acidobacteriota bacterium]